MEYIIEARLKTNDSDFKFSFCTPSPYSTKDDAERMMRLFKEANPEIEFEVWTTHFANPGK